MSKPVYRVVQGEEPTAPMGSVKLRCGDLASAKKEARRHAKSLSYADVVSVYLEGAPFEFTLVYDLNAALRSK